MVNELEMADVQAIIALHGRGWSDRRIARELGVHRETVARHVALWSAGVSKPATNPPHGWRGPELGGANPSHGSGGPEPGRQPAVGQGSGEQDSSKPNLDRWGSSEPAAGGDGLTGSGEGPALALDSPPLGVDAVASGAAIVSTDMAQPGRCALAGRSCRQRLFA